MGRKNEALHNYEIALKLDPKVGAKKRLDVLKKGATDRYR